MNTPPVIAVQPYLFFEGRCEEAIEFYRKAIGAEIVMLMRFKESPDQSMCAPGTGEKIMHATLKAGPSLFMLSDGRCGGKQTYDGFALSVSAADEAGAQKMFTALSEGGKATMPLTKTFFSPAFGMLTDKFGVGWMVIVHSMPPA
ncbi:MAG TPA: VOC family protein [Verrucomicrobiae bacterium]|jgi:PhnB protein|nr:VOC family protein [Verrucomicrobiae bacterium]